MPFTSTGGDQRCSVRTKAVGRIAPTNSCNENNSLLEILPSIKDFLDKFAIFPSRLTDKGQSGRSKPIQTFKLAQIRTLIRDGLPEKHCAQYSEDSEQIPLMVQYHEIGRRCTR